MDTSLSVPTIDKRQRIPDRVIHSLVRQLVADFHPQRVILFGSYAYGEPKPESDLDLLVVIESPLRESELAMQIRRKLNILFGLDLLVYSPQKLAQRLGWGDSTLREIMERGVVLYESPHA